MVVSFLLPLTVKLMVTPIARPIIKPIKAPKPPSTKIFLFYGKKDILLYG
jgi:hypothetical protein